MCDGRVSVDSAMNTDDNHPHPIDRRRRQVLTGIAGTVGSLWLTGCGGDGSGGGAPPPSAQPGPIQTGLV